MTEPTPKYVLVDCSLLKAACAELREWKVAKGGDDQVVLNLEAGLYRERHAALDLIDAAPELLAALQALQSFVAVMIGRGPDAVIPDTIDTPIGVPIKIGELMRDATAAVAKATGAE